MVSKGKGWKIRYPKGIPVFYSGTVKSLCNLHCDSSVSLNIPEMGMVSLFFGWCDIV